MIDLTQFCSKDKHLFSMMAPFSLAGFTWATDGSILVRVPMRSDIPEVCNAPV
jgi:hypothetical protein